MLEALQPVAQKGIALTMAIFMSLSQTFSLGIVHYKKENYKAAAESFTKVMEYEVKENPLLEPALYWRSKCYAQLKEKDKAAADIKTLLEHNPAGPFSDLAAADYKALTGKNWSDVDTSTPERTWRSFQRAIKRQDAKAMLRCCTGRFKETFTQMTAAGGAAYWQAFSMQMGIMEFKGADFNKKKTRAAIHLLRPGNNHPQKLVLELVDKQWLIATEYRRSMEAEFLDPDTMSYEAKARMDTNRLRQLDAAIEQYTLAQKGPPAKLADVHQYVRDFDNTKISIVDGKPFVFAFPKKGGEPWVFNAVATNGKRQGRFGSQLKTVPEAEFKKMATQAGIKIPQDWKKLTVTPADEKEIRALIVQLGAKSFKERKDAFDRLKAMGGKAGKLLAEAQKSNDMEIAIQAKKLLAEL